MVSSRASSDLQSLGRATTPGSRKRWTINKVLMNPSHLPGGLKALAPHRSWWVGQTYWHGLGLWALPLPAQSCNSSCEMGEVSLRVLGPGPLSLPGRNALRASAEQEPRLGLRSP